MVKKSTIAKAVIFPVSLWGFGAIRDANNASHREFVNSPEYSLNLIDQGIENANRELSRNAFEYTIDVPLERFLDENPQSLFEEYKSKIVEKARAINARRDSLETVRQELIENNPNLRQYSEVLKDRRNRAEGAFAGTVGTGLLAVLTGFSLFAGGAFAVGSYISGAIERKRE